MSHRSALALVLIAFAILASAYSFVVPLGEAPDEVSHFDYVRSISGQSVESGEAHQPPLYYLVGAGLTAWIPNQQMAIIANPDWGLDDPNTPNLLLHTRQEGFPFTNGVLAWHVLRLLSVALGLVSVWATYFLALEIFPNDHHLAIAAAALGAFIPAFTFLSAVVNNDILVIALSTLALLVFFRTARGAQISRLVVLGLMLGLAVLAKISALALWLPIGLAMLLGWHRGWRGNRFVSIAIVFVVALVIVAPWLIYNQWTFGDPFNTAYMLSYSTPRPSPMTLNDWGIYAARMGESFWGKFGGAVSLVMPQLVYVAMSGLIVLGLIGAILQSIDWRKGRVPRQTQIAWTISILFWALLAAAQIRLMVTMLGMDQARQIFAGLPLLSIFIVAGILRLFRQRKFAAGTLTIGMALIAIAALFFVVSIYAPHYSNASIANGDSIDFGDQIRVVDYRIDHIQVARGDSMAVQIDWQASKDVIDDDWLMLQLVGVQGMIAQQEGVPANGRTTTDWWRAGQAFSSRHVLAIPIDFAPGKYQLRLGLHPYGRWDWLTARGGDFYPLGTIEVR